MKNLKAPKFLMLKPSQIVEDKTQKKSHNPIELEALLGSISANGIIEPLILSKEKGSAYRLISGSKRLFCAREIGLRRIPCIVLNISPEAQRRFRLITSLCRYETHYLEHAKLLKEIMEAENLEEGQLAAVTGLRAVTVQNKLRLLELSPEIKEKLIEFNLSETGARIISRLPKTAQLELLERATRENLSERGLQLEISRILTEEKFENIDFSLAKPKEEPPAAPKRKSALGDAKLLTNSLLRLVGRAEESGLPATFKTVETEKYTEYKIRIAKAYKPSATQLKIV